MPDVEPAINAIDPLGSLFERRLALALTDSQVAKMQAVDKRYESLARPLRRQLDSLRTVAHDWPGYRPEKPAPVDTAHLPPAARDSVLQLRDALAGVSARLHAEARRARSEAVDVLLLEQLERLAQLSGPFAVTVSRPGRSRSGGGGYATTTPTTSVVRSGPVSYPHLPDPLEGIALADSQRTKVDSIRAAFHAEARALGEPRPSLVAPLRDLLRRQYDAIRAVLTSDQQAAFDKNRGSDAGHPPPAAPGR